MRLPTPPEHIKFQWREQDFCKNVLLAEGVRGGYAPIGGRVSRSEAQHGNVTKQNLLERYRPEKLSKATFSSFSETSISRND